MPSLLSLGASSILSHMFPKDHTAKYFISRTVSITSLAILISTTHFQIPASNKKSNLLDSRFLSLLLAQPMEITSQFGTTVSG